MNILLVDQDGVGLSFALRCHEAGHQVRLFIKPSKSVSPDTGKGFRGVERIDNWVPSVSWSDLRICMGGDRHLEKMEFFAKKGFPFFTLSKSMGIEFLKENGIDIPEYRVFRTMDEAKRHVLKTNKKLALKTMEDEEGYVPHSAADLVAWIDRTPPPKGEVILQTFIKGIEMVVSRFMGSKGWIGPWNESFGTVAYFTETSRLGTETLGKLEKGLLKLGHRGGVSLRFIIDEKGKPWTLEFTKPIFNLMLGSIKGDPIQWMKDAMDGKDTTSFSEDVGVCIELNTKEETHGVPIYGVTRGNRAHIHPQAVQILNLPDMDKSGKIANRAIWASAGEYLAVITGFGKNISQAAKRAYKTMDELHVANPIIRDDIGRELKTQLPILHSQGYALSCQF